MLFQNLTRDCEIGANCYRIDVEGVSLVLDAGMHPRRDGKLSLPDLTLLQPESVDAIVLTHAHLDHLGSLPILMGQHSDAPVFMTEMTGALADAMLHNSVNVMGHKFGAGTMDCPPFFTHKEIERHRKRWDFRRPNEAFTLPGTEVTLEFFDSGHVAGSSAIHIQAAGRSIFYTGDVHFEDQTISCAAAFPDDLSIDILIVETTRGASPRQEGYTREREISRLADAINHALDRGGSVLMPVFALGKTQELLIVLHELKRRGDVIDADVFIGGLGTKVTGIFDKLRGRTRRHYADMKILRDTDVVFSPKNRSNDFSYSSGNIYALSSGMMTEKTVSNRFAFHFLDNPRNSLLFVGYVAPDTPAGQILDTEPENLVTLDADYAPVELKCDIERFDFSGHAPRENIRDFIERASPETVILVHGDADATAWFEASLSPRLPDTRIISPTPGEKIAL